MDENSLKGLLEAVQQGRTSVRDAVERLRRLPFESTGFATIDHHRAIRCGFPEVIYCPGKSIEQVRAIFARLAEAGGNILATRASQQVYERIAADFPGAEYHPSAGAITLRQTAGAEPTGRIALVAAGTSDLPVAEEARVTAEIMGQRVTTHYDVGVAGLHRLLAQAEALQSAQPAWATAPASAGSRRC